jgi:hypothetical protein
MIDAPESSLKHRRSTLAGQDDEDRDQLLGSSGKDTEDALEHQQKLQDQLSEDLQKRAALLKNNTNLFQDLLQKDKDLLQKTETEMEKNALRLQKERGRIAQLTSSSWTLTLLIWGSVLLVIIMFMGTFIFMRTFKPRKTSTATHKSKGFWNSGKSTTVSIPRVTPTTTAGHSHDHDHSKQGHSHNHHKELVFEEGWLW